MIRHKLLPANTQEYLKTAALWKTKDVYGIFFVGVVWGIIIGTVFHVF